MEINSSASSNPFATAVEVINTATNPVITQGSVEVTNTATNPVVTLGEVEVTNTDANPVKTQAVVVTP